MLIYIYLFAMILGGVLLGASILLGGKDVDADSDVDGSPDGDLDAQGDIDADHGGLEKDLDVSDVGVAGDFFLWSIRSIRFWTFFAAFFGASGLLLDGLDLASPWVALALSVALGATTGFGAAGVLRALSKDTAGEAASSGDYIGKTVRVVVPVDKAGPGKVRLNLKGHDFDVLALTDEDQAFEKNEEAIIIEMEGSRARIARINSKS